ncbi:hypothetical protein GCM10027039_27290 [Terrabacter koreensis]
MRTSGGEGVTGRRGGRVVRAAPVAAATLGGLGLVLAGTTTVWPTLVLSVRMPRSGDPTRGSEQRFWAWGRDVVSYTSDGLVLDDDIGPHPVPRLLLLVAVLVLAAVALVAVAVRPGRRTEQLAAVCTALALGTVASSTVARWSFDDRTAMLQPSVRTVTTAAGWSESLALVLLLVALALLLGPSAASRVRGTVAAWVRAGGRRPSPEPDEAKDRAQVGFTDDRDAGRP